MEPYLRHALLEPYLICSYRTLSFVLSFADGTGLAVPRCRGELIAVEAIRALKLLSRGLKERWRYGEGVKP